MASITIRTRSSVLILFANMRIREVKVKNSGKIDGQ
jgi:hypothetical protein